MLNVCKILPLLCIVLLTHATTISKTKGMTFVTWQAQQYGTAASDQSLRELAQTGTTSIALIITYYTPNISSTEILASSNTPTNSSIAHVLGMCKLLNLRVLLKPHVDVMDGKHDRSSIGLGFSSAEQITMWFAHYSVVMQQMAQLASEYHDTVYALCIGTELMTMEFLGGTKYWQQIVQDVKMHFTGPLTYAALTASFNLIPFMWQLVDIIGVDAYFPLAAVTAVPSQEQLLQGWQPIQALVQAVAQRHNKTVLFTEAGFRSVTGTNIEPWNYWTDAPLNMTAQASCYQSLLDACWNESWFAGVYWWAWLAEPTDGGPQSKSHTPHGKLAQQVLTNFYTKH